MNEISEKTALERYMESLKSAASRARQMAPLKKDNAWFQVADQLEQLQKIGVRLATGKALTRQEVLKKLDLRQQQTGNA